MPRPTSTRRPARARAQRAAGPASEIAAYAAVVAELVAALQLDALVLAGHSMGGAIALELALQQPGWLPVSC
jgi:pimeloyl-ACP methyl ester carboxylesterase